MSVPLGSSARPVLLDGRTAPFFAFLLALAVAACGGPPPPSGPSRTVTTRRSGDTTEVSITEGDESKENPQCTAYCERVAACWYARPGVDPTLGHDAVLSRCRAEHEGCKTPTTDTLCCAAFTDCQDFVRCEGQTHDLVRQCQPGSARAR